MTSLQLRTRLAKAIIVPTLVVMASLVGGAAVVAKHADLSGSWARDDAKSEFGDHYSPNSWAYRLTIRQVADTIAINRLSRNARGEQYSYLEALPFNGNPIETVLPPRNTTRKAASVRWSANGDTLIEVARYKDSTAAAGPAQRDSAVERWSLTDERQVLTMVHIDVYPSGNEQVTVAYHRE